MRVFTGLISQIDVMCVVWACGHSCICSVYDRNNDACHVYDHIKNYHRNDHSNLNAHINNEHHRDHLVHHHSNYHRHHDGYIVLYYH